jgi:RNAse (barnase) inhibitor barstar
LAKLPEYMQEEFRKLTISKDDTLVRWADVNKLYTQMSEEYAEHPDKDGPELLALWDTLMTPKEVQEASNKPRELSVKRALDLAQSVNSSSLSRALLIATRQQDGNFGDIDRAIVEGETAISLLSAIKEYLGTEDYNQFIEEVLAKRDAEKVAETEEEEELVEA